MLDFFTLTFMIKKHIILNRYKGGVFMIQRPKGTYDLYGEDVNKVYI